MSSYAEYIDVISDGCIRMFPDNTSSAFTNQLPCPQEFPENTYVAVNEINFVNCMYNITAGQETITIFDWLQKIPVGAEGNENGTEAVWGEYIVCPIEEGFYGDFPSMCKAVNKAIKDSGIIRLANKDIFSYNPINMKYSYDVRDLWISIFINGNLTYFLGFELQREETANDFFTIGKPKLTTTYEWTDENGIKSIRPLRRPGYTFDVSMKDEKTKAPLMKAQLTQVGQLSMTNTFAIYSDIVTSQIFGGEYGSILRAVPFSIKDTSNSGNSTTIVFDNLYFLKVNRSYIPSIRIELRDLSGNLLAIKAGRTRVKLKFTVRPPLK